MEDLEIISLAARYRVAVFENRKEGGIQVATRIAALQNSKFNSQMLGKRVVWHEWFNNSFIHHIQAAVLHFESVGLSKTDLRRLIIGDGTVIGDQVEVEAKCRANWQKTAKRELRNKGEDALAIFTRRRLDRWQIPLLNGWRTRKAFGVAHRLHGMVPPRIMAAIVRTWYNGWCTGRRFQQSGTCIFGCQYEDSIEHYSRCPIVMNFGHRYLNLERGGHNLDHR